MKAQSTVRVWTEDLAIPTYMPEAPDKNPMFLENRVYQGSSGRVYPLPFTDRIAEKKIDRKWKAVWIENEYLRVMILPEIGGRIHSAQDKTNGYDFIYNQHVIKPALVGLAGPWLSGGIEFNWPQHHRPATFLPVNFRIEEHTDGSKTVWCGDHDPLVRMKGMHGICLHPGRSYMELKARVFNRTRMTQTFLWWANVATQVHEGYQSFFPPDVYYVADHARRAMSEYPLCQGRYYGVDYGKRARCGVPADERPASFVPPHCLHGKIDFEPGANATGAADSSKIPRYAPNDLSWYANIPVPTSYMCMGSKEDFFGGYDHIREAGIVHYASHHIAPGKKQWTWGNHEFGYAWDRNLTDSDGPYIELMAGVYTDNQPDFSFLHPGETKSWSQFWYPIRKIGPAQSASLDAAVSVRMSGSKLRVGVSVTRVFLDATIRVESGRRVSEWKADLSPDQPFIVEDGRYAWIIEQTTVCVLDGQGGQVIAWRPVQHVQGEMPPPASEPEPPERISSADELYITGLHLEQYRHATRCPTLYWREALRRDPLDSRCNNAMGLWQLRRGEFQAAECSFRKSVERATRRNGNPRDGEAFYNLGLCLRWQWDAMPEAGSSSPLFQDAYDALHKAVWDQSWAANGYLALAEMDCCRGRWEEALAHLNLSLRQDTENLNVRNLKAMVLRRLDCAREADCLLQDTLALDPLDCWARWLLEGQMDGDLQVRLDLAHDLGRAGFYADAIALLKGASAVSRDMPDQNLGAAPLIAYALGWFYMKNGDAAAAMDFYKRGSEMPFDYCFPARLEEMAIFKHAMALNPQDARAPYYLGNLYYDRRRREEALELWERSVKLDAKNAIAWRNLGIGCFNVRKQPAKALLAYEKAFRANSDDARLLYESDQLRKRIGEPPAQRLRRLEQYPALIERRDDLTVELCDLYNQTGQQEKAIRILRQRQFQPWEGGEGMALGQHVRAHLAVGRIALAQGRLPQAQEHFLSALNPPFNLGEAKHLLANQSDIYYWLGMACKAMGNPKKAREYWTASAGFKGDFQQMSTRTFSEMTFYSALSWRRLGQEAKARKLLQELQAYGAVLQRGQAKIDYFATSLPTMLLFEDDIQVRQETRALILQAQSLIGLGNLPSARAMLRKVLGQDPANYLAADLLEVMNQYS